MAGTQHVISPANKWGSFKSPHESPHDLAQPLPKQPADLQLSRSRREVLEEILTLQEWHTCSFLPSVVSLPDIVCLCLIETTPFLAASAETSNTFNIPLPLRSIFSTRPHFCPHPSLFPDSVHRFLGSLCLLGHSPASPSWYATMNISTTFSQRVPLQTSPERHLLR